MNRRWYFGLTAIIVIAVGIFVVKQLSNGPAVGTVLPSNAPAVTVVKSAIEMTPVAGKTASFARPSLFALLQAEPAAQPILESYRFMHKDIQTSQLSVTILRVDAAGADSSLQLRRSQPQNYTESTAVNSSNSFVIMTNTSAGKFDQVAYTIHGGMAGEIALSGSDQAGGNQLEEEFTKVLNSWTWH